MSKDFEINKWDCEEDKIKRTGTESASGQEEENERGTKRRSKHKFKSFKGEQGRRWVLLFVSEGLGRGGGRLFSVWLGEALIRHIWAEVILDVSHTPAGELVLGQVQAQAAQLENCGLGFRSLKESPREHLWSTTLVVLEGCLSFQLFRRVFYNPVFWLYLQVLSIHEEEHRLSWVVHDHSSLVFTTQSVQTLLLVVPMMKFKLGLCTRGTTCSVQSHS